MAAKRASETAKSTRVFGQRQESAKMFRVGLYARVSTHDQQTLPLQMRTMREYAAKRGWTVPLRSKKSVPARPNANCARSCSMLHAVAISMSYWSGGWTGGAVHWSIWS